MKRLDEGTDFQSQLLQQVRKERQQCFAVAEAAARQRASLNCSLVDTVVKPPQEEIYTARLSQPTFQADQRPASSVPLCGFGGQDLGAVQPEAAEVYMATSGGPASVPGHGATGWWNAEDDIAQADALRALRFLGEQSRRVSTLEAISEESSSRKAVAQEDLSTLQDQVASLEEALAKERDQRQSMQKQMLCLEQELDGKEATIGDFERAIERKEEELTIARWGRKTADDDVRVKALELQLRDRDRQLEAKDGHIMRLLSVLRQHRSAVVNLDEDYCKLSPQLQSDDLDCTRFISNQSHQFEMDWQFQLKSLAKV